MKTNTTHLIAAAAITALAAYIWRDLLRNAADNRLRMSAGESRYEHNHPTRGHKWKT